MRLLPFLFALALASCSPPEPTQTDQLKVEPEPATETVKPDPEPEPLPTAQEPVGYQRIYDLKNLERTTLSVNGKKIKVWIADDEGKRTEGMMSLTEKDVLDDEGMLFVFPDSTQRSFWMQNTVLPLDIIYISPDKKVLNVQKGKPFDESPLPSAGSAQYVLELKQGQAQKFGIRKGTIIAIPKTITAKD